jgi:hypothetical protein
MEVYYDNDRTYPEPRPHPYEAGSPDQSGFVDFKTRPESIETVLEDFRPFASRSAIRTFYSFLRWINGPDSHLETNDCAFRVPSAHTDANSNLALGCHGRVYVFYRNLSLNSSSQHSDWLCGKLMQLLDGTDPEFTGQQGVVGFTLNSALQLSLWHGIRLPDGTLDTRVDDPGFGRHLMLSFWAYGNDEAEVFQNLDRLFKNIWEATKKLSNEIDAAFKEQSRMLHHPT